MITAGKAAEAGPDFSPNSHGRLWLWHGFRWKLSSLASLGNEGMQVHGKDQVDHRAGMSVEIPANPTGAGYSQQGFKENSKHK